MTVETREAEAGLPELDAAEQRVLGSLLEKQVTVPASYPMTVNAVRTACNQTSSRHPVVDYDDRDVHDTLRALKARDLVGVTWSDSGKRTMKYVEKLSVRLGLPDAERALVTVLLLRGAQTPGELQTRTDRLHRFVDRETVESTLAELATGDEPLVRQLERRPGQRDARWIHLLGPVPDEAAPVAATGTPAVDRESVLAGGGEARDARIRATYDTVAASYADALAGELDDLPFERWLLDRVAELAGPGPAVEVGCGPGHVTAYLDSMGMDARGLDLSPEMVAQARRLHPDVRYDVGDLRRLMRPEHAAGWTAVLAWYSLIHLAASELPAALDALLRPLQPGGLLVVAAHAGAEVRHLDSWFDHDGLSLDFVLHDPHDLRDLLAAAGLVEVEWWLRGPSTWRGETSERVYLTGRKPGS